MANKVWASNDFDNEGVWAIEPYEALVFADTEEGVLPTLIPDEDSIASAVDYITKFVKLAIDTKRRLLDLVPLKVVHPDRPNMKSIKLSKGGKCFLRCLRLDLDRIIDKYPEIGKFNRYFGIYYDAVMREVEFPNGTGSFAAIARLDWLWGEDKNCVPDDILALHVKYSNEIVEQIRQGGNSDEFKKWRAAIERQPKENEGRLWSLIEACLSVNHHALVLRFDLGYGQYYCDPELSGERAVSYEEIREHRTALRRFLKRDLKGRLPRGACKGMVFTIKLEYGLDKGYHFHVMALLNGDVVRRDGGITELICAHWRTVITKGSGGACNCNVRKYKKRGIGSIRYGQHDKLDILKKDVVPYITKVDYYGKMVKSDGHRTFWPSQPPKVGARPKGRRRAKLNSEDSQGGFGA
ncbi:hypothetical protein [Cupriavidus sp. DL-D2]|uniref:hypothetical protein n=1 Tax=Cupriavidus sp. DL-D2 TaxID=3144974 RepID=UPI003213981D